MNISTTDYSTKDLKCFELPTQHVNLLSAFTKKSNKVKKQALLDVNMGGFRGNQIMLLSSQLLMPNWGLEFLVDYQAVIKFCRAEYYTQDQWWMY